MAQSENILPPAGNSRVDLTSLLECVASNLAGRANARGMEVIAFTDASVPARITADAGVLKRILLGLGKFTLAKAGGEEIAFYAETEKKGRSTASIRFYISGLARDAFPEGHPATFAALVKSEKPTKNDHNNSSLAAVRKLAGTIGTRISLADSPVKGYVFTFAIKLAEEPVFISREPLTDLQGARVLVVDNNPVSRQALSKMLDSMGCKTKAVASGVEVLPTLVRGLLSNSSYRLVLLDQEMPGLNGEEVLHIIRQNKMAKDTRIVMLSPLGKREASEKAFGSVCSGILTKPVHRNELREMVEYALGIHLEAHGSKKLAETIDTAKEASGQKLNILLAEDDVFSQQIATLLLGRLGLSADLVFNGAEAVAAAKTHVYDLILMDMHMPVMNGPDAAREIRKLDDERKNVPIIAMTASDIGDVEHRCRNAGMNGFIIKPLDIHRLSQVISECMEGAYRKRHFPISMPERDIPSIESPVLDLSVALPIFENDLLQYQTFLEEFMKSLPSRLARIEAAHRKHEWKSIEREAHTLKGIAASVGAMKLSDVAAHLEGRSKGRSSELIPITKTIHDIRDIIKELEKARNMLPVGITQELKLRRGLHAGLPD